MKCFLVYNFNTQKAKDYLDNECKVIIYLRSINDIYKAMRNVIYDYLKRAYQTVSLGVENKNTYFAVDESLLRHKNGKQIWLLGAIDNITKVFRIEGTYTRDAVTLEKFITLNIETGNNIVTDGRSGYAFLDAPDSNFRRFSHNHGGGDFGFGQESTSHIESLWYQLKAKIKEIYHLIPTKNLMHFVKEAEYRIKIKNLNPEKKNR